MNKRAIEELMKQLPNKVQTFEKTDYPLPIKAAFLGSKEIDITALRAELEKKQEKDVKELLRPILLAAELVESSIPDKQDFFMDDKQVQGYVFGTKWRAGWVLVLGGEQGELISLLNEKSFRIFTDQPGIENTVFIGNRDTSPVYFLQMMVRYAMIWGMIESGQDHEMGHYLEKDMPGFMIINDALPPLKYLIALGLMSFGCPAVVPSSYPFPYGRRTVADKPREKVEKGGAFANLRRKYIDNEIIELPEYCNTAYANEKFEAKQTLGGDKNSFFFLQKVDGIEKRIEVIGNPGKGIGILVKVADENLTDDLAQFMEPAACNAINYLKGVRASQKDGNFLFELAADTGFDANKIAESIYWGFRLKYPRLKDIAIEIIFDDKKQSQLSSGIRETKLKRQTLIENMTEDNVGGYCSCIECRPFSLEHTCIVTPARQPMCGSRTYLSIKAYSRYGAAQIPWKRQSERQLPMTHVFNKGEVIDQVKGEYEGVNAIYGILTQGRINRIFLHSLREFPHTSCGCFRHLAFWIEEVEGIGIMKRGSMAMTPKDESWTMLANRAGGKQAPGITGVTDEYICSKEFLKGDGGVANVVWMDSSNHETFKELFAPDQMVATEKDVTTIDELKRFVKR